MGGGLAIVPPEWPGVGGDNASAMASSSGSNASGKKWKSLKLFMSSKRPGNYCEAMRKQGHLSSMSNIAF
jgi:hypothetical protein